MLVEVERLGRVDATAGGSVVQYVSKAHQPIVRRRSRLSEFERGSPTIERSAAAARHPKRTGNPATGYRPSVSLPQLAVAGPARREADRLRAAAANAVAAAQARGVDLDDPTGAAVALARLAPALADLPLPASGQSTARLAGLAAVTGVDVTLGRLAEAHADALAILSELGGPPPQPAQRWAVWAAEGPAATLEAHPDGSGGWRLEGAKPWCSGASFCSHALVTAAGEAGRALYAVELDTPQAVALPGTWQAVGLSGTATEEVCFTSATAVQVGAPGTYLTRPGFWHGAIGVAAAWWGGAVGVASPLYEKGAAHPHALAHLGAVETSLQACAALLRDAAATIDVDPQQIGERHALTVRSAVEAAADDVIERVGRALGPAPLSQDRAHARRVADLALYVRQSHAERDLARLGELASTDHQPDERGDA